MFQRSERHMWAHFLAQMGIKLDVNLSQGPPELVGPKGFSNETLACQNGCAIDPNHSKIQLFYLTFPDQVW